MKQVWLLIVLAIWLVGGIVVAIWGADGEPPTVLLVLFGWCHFLRQTVPRMTVDRPAVGLAVAAFLLFVGIAHVVFSAFFREKANHDVRLNSSHSRWRFIWTLSILAIVLLTFAGGIAMVGITHQSIWIAFSAEPLHDEVLGGSYSDDSSENNLRTVGLGISSLGRYPEAPESSGYKLHSWETLIGPYISYNTEGIDVRKPWNDPQNIPEFEKLYPTVINPSFDVSTWRNAEGLGLSHYAANRRVIGEHGVGTPAEITDGASHTLLLGEVNANLEPWGKPGKGRDPALGLGRSEQGFGGVAGRTSTCFLMADGSVRHISNDADPSVLKRLATPAGRD